MNYAYVTVLSTNNYYKGVVALFESIKLTKPKYNQFVVVVNDTIEKDIIQKLRDRNYIVIEKNRIELPRKVENKTYDYWKNTFEKFHIFELTQYDKIIYLDSDMYVKRNIDELFQYPHMSAVVAGKDYVKTWENIGSGLMVVVPQKNVVQGMLEILKNTEYDKDIGDQDIIETYYDWHNQHLEISENYNLFADYTDYYINKLNYQPENIAVIHFIGPKKPWMLTLEEIEEKKEKYQREKKHYQLQYFTEYTEIIKQIK